MISTLNVEAIAAISTAIGVFLVVLQIRQSEKQSQTQLREQRDQLATQFEDELTREYREIIKDIPVNALLGKN